MTEIKIVPAYDRLEEVRILFAEYADWLGFDLCFQNFDEELAGLPGRYAPPTGRLYLAVAGEEAAGCVAMRGLDETRCELKRLYLRPAFRGQGAAPRMLETVLADARAIGYRRMLLDTLPVMGSAVRLYERFGFEPTEPYCDNPFPDAKYLALELV